MTFWEKLRRTSRGFQSEVRLDKGWTKGHKKYWPVSLACNVMGVSTSGFFEDMRRKGTDQPSKPGANRRISNEALLAHIRAINVEVKQEYGWPKM